MKQQLSFQWIPRVPVDFEHFDWSENAILHNMLLTNLQAPFPKERFFYVWAESGAGKSHILQACCNGALIQGPAAYIPLSECLSLNMDVSILENLSELSVVAIDNLEVVMGNKEWEEALFHCYNQIMSNSQARLILASRYPIDALPIRLLDLHSRLKACMVFQLKALSDERLAFLLNNKAKERGLMLSEEVCQFLLRRCSRVPGKLLEHLDVLDKAAWEEQRRLTIPFVKKILSL